MPKPAAVRVATLVSYDHIIEEYGMGLAEYALDQSGVTVPENMDWRHKISKGKHGLHVTVIIEEKPASIPVANGTAP